MKFFLLLLLLLLLLLSVVTAFCPTLSWDRNSEPEVAGYRVYRGVSPREYTTVVDAGNEIEYVIPSAMPGVTEFFAVTAYEADGLESDFSDEVFWTERMPVPVTPYLVWKIPAGLHLLESCDDLTAAIWNRVAFIQGPFDYLIAVDVTLPQRFYRYSAQ